ncbi:MAG: TraB/GumN family protein [Dysgonamonadaceae bacterium]
MKEAFFKLRTRYYLFFIFLSLCSFMNAQLCWQITGKELVKPSYLFGTHHLIDKKEIKGFGYYEDLANKCDAVVGEIDMTDSLETSMKLMKASRMENRTLKDLYPQNIYSIIDKEFKSVIGVGLERFQNLKPITLLSMYTMSRYKKEIGNDSDATPIDLLFQRIAIAEKKRIIGLETADEQIDVLFNSISLESQAKMLLDAVKEKDDDTKMMHQLQKAYLKGNMAMAAQFSEEDKGMTPQERFALLDNRNRKWFEKLPSLMQEQSCFVAVGFMHLVGKNGLVDMLKKSGYTLKPVLPKK